MNTSLDERCTVPEPVLGPRSDLRSSTMMQQCNTCTEQCLWPFGMCVGVAARLQQVRLQAWQQHVRCCYSVPQAYAFAAQGLQSQMTHCGQRRSSA